MAKKTTKKAAPKKTTAKARTTKAPIKKDAQKSKETVKDASTSSATVTQENSVADVKAGAGNGPTESAPSGNLPPEYKTLAEIVQQLEFCGYKALDGNADLKNNLAFMKLKERAEEEGKMLAVFGSDAPMHILQPNEDIVGLVTIPGDVVKLEQLGFIKKEGLKLSINTAKLDELIKAEEELEESKKCAKPLTLVYGISDNMVKVDGFLNIDFPHFMSHQNAAMLACSDGSLIAGAFGLNGKWAFTAITKGSAFKEIVEEKEVHFPEVPGNTNMVIFDKELEWMVMTPHDSAKIEKKEHDHKAG